jgi:hypothetical protein
MVLYGCETLSLTLREVHRLGVFENRVLRIFGLRRDEVTEEWRKLHNEELHDLYSLPSIIRVVKSRRIRWVEHVAQMGRRETRIGCWCESQKERGPLGRPTRRWVDNIRMDLVDVGWDGVDWIGLAQDRDRLGALVNSVLNLRVP